MKGDFIYWFVVNELRELVWGGNTLDEKDLPKGEPVVFVSNHAAALGPIAVMSSLPYRVYPWVICDMMEWGTSAEYLQKDFVEPQLHVPHGLSMAVSRLIAQVSVRLLRAVDCIPVWHGEDVLKTYKNSIEYLENGRSLLIFPEDPSQPMNDLYQMTPFYKGFVRLGEMYYEDSKKLLRFFPLAVHPVFREIRLGKPIKYNPYNQQIKERIRIKSVLESAVHELYLGISQEHHAGVPLPH